MNETYILCHAYTLKHQHPETNAISGPSHYDDVIMSTIASQITSLTIVYSTVYSSADQSKHQSSASLAFVWEIHRGPVNFPHKWPVTRKMFPFDDVIMPRDVWWTVSWNSTVFSSYINVYNPCYYWCRQWVVAGSMSGNYLDQFCVNFVWTLRDQSPWNSTIVQFSW